jgi:hypothetical protein
MSDTDSNLVITGTLSLAEGDLSLALGEQIGQRSTLKFGAAAINFIISSLQGRKMDSKQSNTRNDGPQDSTSAITTDSGN